MHSFHYHNGSLHCEDVDLTTISDLHGTPAYVYSAGTLRDHYRRLDLALADIDHAIEYAVKANSNLSVLKLLADEGSGFDIVSGGELRRVIEAGGDPGKCTFAGVGKTREEIEYALAEEIYCFNAESEEEVVFISKDLNSPWLELGWIHDQQTSSVPNQHSSYLKGILWALLPRGVGELQQQ